MSIYNTQKCKIFSQTQNVGYFIRMFISRVQIFKNVCSTEPITKEQRQQVFKIDDHLNSMQTASKKREYFGEGKTKMTQEYGWDGDGY